MWTLVRLRICPLDRKDLLSSQCRPGNQAGHVGFGCLVGDSDGTGTINPLALELPVPRMGHLEVADSYVVALVVIKEDAKKIPAADQELPGIWKPARLGHQACLVVRAFRQEMR